MIDLPRVNRQELASIPIGGFAIFSDCPAKLVTSYAARIPQATFTQRRCLLVASDTPLLEIANRAQPVVIVTRSK